MSQFIFLSVEDFKSATNTTGKEIEFMSSDPTKLFGAIGGKTYKAQSDLDPSKPVKFMYSETEGFNEGCFVNVKPLAVKFKL